MAKLEEKIDHWGKLRGELEELLNVRGLLGKISVETGAEYRRLHELVKGGHEPRYNLGKSLEVWLECATILVSVRRALTLKEEVPFGQLVRLEELMELIPYPLLRMKLDGIVELAGPSMKRVNPSPEELRDEVAREMQFRSEAMKHVDSSLAEIADAITDGLSP